MATTITVQPNQSMLDVILQAFGTMEAGMQFCIDNNVSISDVPVPGSTMIVSVAAMALGDQDVLTLMARDNVRFGTLGATWPPDMLLNDDGKPLLNDNGSYLYSD